MGRFFSALLAKLADIVGWVGKLIVAIFKAGWDFAKDVLSWPVEQVMQLAKTAIEAVDVSAMTNSTASWGTLPAEVLNILGLLGVGTACTIIASAIAVRLGLQLIPFTRLGS